MGTCFTAFVVVIVGIFTFKNFRRMAYRTDPEVFTLTD
jgi:hypothetical protein